METRERQILEKNRTLFGLGFAYIGFILLIAILGLITGTRPVLGVGRLIIALLCLIVNLVFRITMSRKAVGTHFAMYTMLVAYVTGVLMNPNAFMMNLMYPCVLMVVFFMDRALVIKGTIACIVVNTIYTILQLALYKTATASEVVALFLIAILVCVSAIAIVFILSKHNKQDMDAITEHAENQAKTAEAIIEASSEIRNQLGNASLLMNSLVEATETSNSASNDIASSVHATAETIQNQSIMTASIQEKLESVGEHTEMIRSASEEALQNVNEGTEILDTLREQAFETAEISVETMKTTEELNERIHDVEEIIGTILTISAQTNLLALNASIEAARAGDAGRGFAVVADEIRNLSESTRESTEQITNIIQKLTVEIGNANDNMRRSAASLEEQNMMIEKVSESFQTIQESMEDLGERINNIAGDVEGVVAANQDIMEGITDLSATSEEIAASSESSISLSDNSMECTNNMKVVLDEIMQVSNQMDTLL